MDAKVDVRTANGTLEYDSNLGLGIGAEEFSGVDIRKTIVSCYLQASEDPILWQQIATDNTFDPAEGPSLASSCAVAELDNGIGVALFGTAGTNYLVVVVVFP